MAGIQKRVTLEQWIADALVDGDKDGEISAITLQHHIGSKTTEIHGVRFQNSKKWTARELAQLFQAKADGYAQDLPGGQYFTLEAFYADRPEPQAKHPFEVIGQPDFAGLISEKPDAAGVVGQSMKHLEFQHREMNIMMRHLIDTLAQTNLAQAERLKDQEGELRDSYNALRQLMLGRLTEEHEFKLKEAKVQRENDMWGKLFEYGPLLLDAVTGGKLIPTAKKDTMLIDAMVRSVPVDKLQALVTSLPPEVAGPLMARLEEAHQAGLVAEKAAEDALALRKDPSDDAAGD
jgi:hypothetical protein